MHSPRRFLARAGALLLVADALHAQGLLSQHADVLAKRGDHVAGLAPTVTLSGIVGPPVIAADGSVMFWAHLWGTAATGKSVAYVRASPSGELALHVQSGTAAPDLPGLVLLKGPEPGLAQPVRLNAAGDSFWASGIGGTGVLAVDDSALFVGTAAGHTLVAREGGPAPGTVGGVLSGEKGKLDLDFCGFNAAGHVLFHSGLSGGDVIASGPGQNDAATFWGTPGALQPILRRGDPAPGGALVAGWLGDARLNAAGAVLQSTKLSTLHGSPPATVHDDVALWLYEPGVGNQVVLREGDPAPGVPGALLGNPSGTWQLDLGPACFNDAGQFALVATIHGVAACGSDRALFLGDRTGLTLLARCGDPAPGTDATFHGWDTQLLALNNQGTALVNAKLAGPGVTTANDDALYLAGASGLELVLREGDAAPGLPGSVLVSPVTPVHLNDRGQALFGSSYAQPGEPAFPGLWAYDPELGVQLVVAGLSSIEAGTGLPGVVIATGAVDAGSGGGTSLALNHDGWFTVSVATSDDGGVQQGILRARIGSLTAVPPALAIPAGGAQELRLNAGLAHAGEWYLVLGSITGTAPGLPIGPGILPLNPDPYFQFTLAHANQPPLASTLGALDAEGRATASFTLPAGGFPGLAGLTVHHAFVSFGAAGAAFVSEPAALQLTP